MTFTIRTHHVNITDAIKEYVETKLGRLDKFFSNIMSISVDLDVSQVSVAEERHTISVTVWVPGNVFRAKHLSRDMYASVDFVFEKLEKQLKKHKEKIKEHNRHGQNREITRQFESEFSNHVLLDETSVTPTESAKSNSHYIPKPIYVEDAQLFLDERDISFLMFHNAETNLVNVIYKNDQDSISLIEPRSENN